MNARAKPASFLREAAAGFVVSLVAAAAALTLGFVFSSATVARIVVAGLGLVIVLQTLAHSNETTGRIVTLALWLVVAAAAGWLDVGLGAYVAIHVTLVWLVRSLFTYSSFVEAGLDLGLTALATSFSVLAAVRTDSLFLTIWCFLLVQALHVAVPALAARLKARPAADLPPGDPNRGFADAVRAADEALQRIAARQ